MKLRSYAKVNLTLDILGKRADGYHELNTVFQQVNLYDDIELFDIPEDKVILKCNIKELENENNLAYKAARTLKNRYKIKKGVLIAIDKKIPIGAGLSGGSSNAAAVIKGLNLMWNLNMSKKELMSISRHIGMDVSFHILGGTCMGKGRGEILEKIKDLDKHYAVIVYPNFSIGTKDAYSGLDLKKTGQKKSTERFMQKYDLHELHNDFEFSIIEKFPNIAKVKKDIGKGAILSGSGSCVFKLFKEKDEAKKAFDKLRKKYDSVFIAETINKKIDLAKEMGFCFGVKRALEEIKKVDGKNIYVLGSLIHNPQVIERLEKEGIKTIKDYKEVNEGTIVISAHGIDDKTVKEIKKKGLKVIDLTCPYVEKVHETTKKAEKEGKKIIVFGDKDHTEVKGIVGNLKSYEIIKNASELNKKNSSGKVLLVSQTTRDVDEFKEICIKLKELSQGADVKDTICFATKDRQESALDLAKKSDIMIVVGGKNSSNTLRLAEICSKHCETKHIETEKELETEWFNNKERIGVTAGASTPHEIIGLVKEKIMMML